MASRFLTHIRLSVASRKKRESVAAAIAYISAKNIRDPRTGIMYRYKNRSRGVLKTECFNFNGTLEELSTKMELSENRCNATVCRKLVVALPAGLTVDQRWELVTAIASTLVETWEVAVAAALHTSSKTGDDRNDHAHFVFSTRRYDNGRFTNKTRCFDDLAAGPKEVRLLRQLVSECIIAQLEKVERTEEKTLWDYRSYSSAGLDFEPTWHRGKNGETKTFFKKKSKFRREGKTNRKPKISSTDLAQQLNAKISKYSGSAPHLDFLETQAATPEPAVPTKPAPSLTAYSSDQQPYLESDEPAWIELKKRLDTIEAAKKSNPTTLER
jgi:hypothetical protein